MSLEISAETSFALDLTNATQYGPELHVSANAASDPNGNEADATTGWTPLSLTGTGANVFESQSAVKSTGGYALHADCNDTPTASAGFSWNPTVDVGETYRITFNWRHVGTGDVWHFEVEGIQKAEVTSSDTTFESVDVTVVAGDSALSQNFRERGVNTGGVYVDNYSLKKVL